VTTPEARWYADWQHATHASHFDGRHRLDLRNLVRHYEAFNDVRLLTERVDASRPLDVVEVGCATGEFYRYLGRRLPRARYVGVDISEPAIARARAKYPSGRFAVVRPDVRLPAALREVAAPDAPEVVYAKDVLHHQTSPFEFLADVLAVARDVAVLRCRTRDVGPTELDPEKSCQYHYGGWMPYIVINLAELIDAAAEAAPGAEIVALRSHVVLGGQHGRFLPKDCYLREAGTAETALGVFKRTSSPGRVTVEDRPDGVPRYTLDYWLRRGLARMLGVGGRR
jgi:SAM-dependent methyltransferase